MISSVGSTNITNNFKVFTQKGSKQSEIIQKQIDQLQKEKEKINGNKELSKEESQNRIKAINEQIQELNKQLQQQKMEEQKKEMKKLEEKIQQNNNTNSSRDIKKSTTTDVDMLLSADLVMKNAGKLNSIKTSNINSARVLKIEAKLDESYDITGNAAESIQNKLEKAQDLENQANNIGEKIGKEFSKINKKINEKDKDKDKDKNINNTDTKNEEIEKVKEDIQKKDNESKVMMYVSDENKKQESNFNKKA